MKSLNKENK